MSQQFCLKWNNHMNNMMDVFKNLLSNESMVDVTLACDGLSLKAHKMVLSACSPFFQSLFLENPCKHPIVILKDMKYSELKAIIEFMYHGEVNVAQDQLSALMKTAETLRVKGLAEVTNEKNNQPSNASQDEPTHRSVPRTETPPPKRRRGRVRKRSASDDNRSDDDSEPKIKPPVSPDIEELSGDNTVEASSGHFSNLQSQVPMQTLPSHSSTTNSFHKSSVLSQDPQIEEPPSADESEYGVEPAKLLEQTLTTDDLSARRSGRSSMQTSSMEMQRRPRSSTDHSSSIVPSSMSSEALGSNVQPESPPDIKPELLELDPPMSPVAGPSHSTDNSMMMYMDQSSMSSHPGTSYQDNTALVPQDSQPQVRFICEKCAKVLTSKEALEKHWQRHRFDNSEKRHHCDLCPYATNYSSHLRQHMFTHSGERPFKCSECQAGFIQNWLLRKHMRTRHPEPEAVKCNHCSATFTDPNELQKHSDTHKKDEKSFRCAECRKRFHRSSSLRKHEKRCLNKKATVSVIKKLLAKKKKSIRDFVKSPSPKKRHKSAKKGNGMRSETVIYKGTCTPEYSSPSSSDADTKRRESIREKSPMPRSVISKGLKSPDGRRSLASCERNIPSPMSPKNHPSDLHTKSTISKNSKVPKEIQIPAASGVHSPSTTVSNKKTSSSRGEDRSSKRLKTSEERRSKVSCGRSLPSTVLPEKSSSPRTIPRGPKTPEDSAPSSCDEHTSSVILDEGKSSVPRRKGPRTPDDSSSSDNEESATFEKKEMSSTAREDDKLLEKEYWTVSLDNVESSSKPNTQSQICTKETKER